MPNNPAIHNRDHPAGAKTTKIKCLALAAVPMFPKAVINPRPVRWDGDVLRVDADQDSVPTGDRDARVGA